MLDLPHATPSAPLPEGELDMSDLYGPDETAPPYESKAKKYSFKKQRWAWHVGVVSGRGM